MILNNRTETFRCTAAQKITTLYNNYKTNFPHSYTVTKTSLVVFLNNKVKIV